MLLLVGILPSLLRFEPPGVGAFDGMAAPEQIGRAFGAEDMLGHRRPAAGDLAALAEHP